MPYRVTSHIAAVLMAGAAGAAAAQGVQTGVQVAPLAAPDAFSTPGRATGLPPTLWAGASAQTARAVLPLLAARPLSPAAAALARRVLATGASAPEGAGRDADLAAARANALMFQGDPRAAAAVLAHAPGLDRSSELARAAAETALLAGDDQRACQIGQGLTVGRDETYWLKLRAFCQAIAGQKAQAQLTFDLVQAQVKDPVFTRLMGAKLAGVGNPGAASLRNGLDYALSRSLGLDLAAAKPSAAVAAALANADGAGPAMDPAAVAPDLAVLAGPLAKGEPVREAVLQALLELGASADPKARARGQAASLLAVALMGPPPAPVRGIIAGFATPEGKGSAGRDFALELAAEQKLMGEAALLALWTCAEAGPAGPAIGDRVRIVRALHAVGLDADARAIAFEGLAALK
ncbi:MAG TPA: hypothetical protein VGC92_15215 [Phenylobacterium sp.]|jgi:hypothetical protein